MKQYHSLTENSESRYCEEIGLKVFAIVNIVFTGLAFAVSCGWFLFFTIKALTNYRNDYKTHEDIIVISIIVMYVTLSAIIFAFYVILLMGLFQKRPWYLKAYCVFGVIVTLVVIAASVAMLLLSGLEAEAFFVIAISMFAVCCGYTAVMVMIWAAKVLENKQDKLLAAVEKLNTNTKQTLII